MWSFHEDGWICHWMVSGPKEEAISESAPDWDPLIAEPEMRVKIADHPAPDFGKVNAGENSMLGLPWRYMGGGDGMINLSAFYSTMRKVTFAANTEIVSEREKTVTAVLWGYAGADLYVNGEKCLTLEKPVYKPIQRAEGAIHLKAGRNRLDLIAQHLGVRDTRLVAGVQLKGDLQGLQSTLADEECARDAESAERILAGASVRGGVICLSDLSGEISWRAADPQEDLRDAQRPREWYRVTESKTQVPKEIAVILLRVRCGKVTQERFFEITERIRPKFVPGSENLTYEENREIIFRRIADMMSCNRGEGIGFPIANILARRHFGENRAPGAEKDDAALLGDMLALIEERYDCADFLMAGLIRLIFARGVPPEMEEQVRHAVLNFRYWMDMDGSDGMCFWSENHSLMFYSCAMLAGQIFPDETFPRAGKTGRDLEAWGRARVLEWLSDVEENGFEEFLSSVYMCVTFAVLLNLVDFGDEEISARAWKITDRLLEMLSKHVFRGGMIAPMGRVYRGVLDPFEEGAMALMNLINPALPYSFGEGWLAFFADSRYRLPEGLTEKMSAEADDKTVTGHARVVLYKKENYCLTSVESPRTDGFQREENETLKANPDRSGHGYVKAFNERFHGTTCFEPGTRGYQQHMWHAALDSEAAVFANHPGTERDGGDLRPGYWHGNGVMPWISQEKNELKVVYRIPEDHPVHMVHLYCPLSRFDRFKRDDHWFFLQKGQGYMAIWCSGKMKEWSAGAREGEWRTYGDKTAYWVLCEEGFESLETFEEYARSRKPRIDMNISFESGDRTQYL